MIGILDSGLGGLGVARALEEHLPGLDMTYLGDTGRAPYGGRSADKIMAYVDQGVDFLIKKRVEIMVFACTTLSSVVLSNPGRTYAVPFLDAVTPAVNRALELSRSHRIGVIGPEAVVRSRVFEKQIKGLDPVAKIYGKSAPLLVPLIEDGRLDRPETRMVVKKYLHPLKVRQVDVLIMGCNHYTLIKRTMQSKIGKRAKVVDSARTVADCAKRYFEQHGRIGEKTGGKGSRAYYLTDITERIQSTGKMLYGSNITFRCCDL